MILSANSTDSLTRLTDMRATWIQEALALPSELGLIRVFLAVGGTVNPFNATTPVGRLDVIRVPEAAYSSIYLKTYLGFREFYQHHLDDFDWFMKIDDDTFLQPRLILSHLAERARTLGNDPNHHGNWWYLGHPGPFHVDFEPSTGDHFCWGGPGYMISQALLYTIGPKLHDWTRHPEPFEDVGFYKRVLRSIPPAIRRLPDSGLVHGCQDMARSPAGWTVQAHIDHYQTKQWEGVVSGRIATIANAYDGLKSNVSDVVAWHSVRPPMAVKLQSLYEHT